MVLNYLIINFYILCTLMTLHIEIMNTLKDFQNFSGLKPNKSKCEIVGTGSLNGVKVALCGMKSVNINIETIKILGTHFSYDKIFQQEKNFFDHITKIKNVLKVWRMRDLSIEDKITVFKSLAISKIIHLSLVTTTNNSIINQLEKYKEISFGINKLQKSNITPFLVVMKTVG